MREEESLTPASRLNSDSATSPTWAVTVTTTPTVASCKTSSRKATRSSTRGPYTSAATSPPTSPPTAPAHVFRGDSTGASFGPPIKVPAAMALVSHTHVTMSGSKTKATDPRGCPPPGGGGAGRQPPPPHPTPAGGRGEGGARAGDAPRRVGGHHAVTLPNRRSRRWYSRMAWKRSRRVTSGQSTGVMYSSV